MVLPSRQLALFFAKAQQAEASRNAHQAAQVPFGCRPLRRSEHPTVLLMISYKFLLYDFYRVPR